MTDRAAPFSVNDFEADEARRVALQTAQLREQQERAEEQRRAQVQDEPEPERPFWQ